jgi:Lrp/AsnC family transcriptional regulator for asnA, asnC and gidA
MTNIDELDRRIVEIMQENGAANNTEIARRLGTSEATVRRRRARLEAEDVIRVVAVADPFKLGFTVIAIIGIQVEKTKLHEVELRLIAMPEVRFLGVTLGGYDLMLEAWFRSNDLLLHFVTVTLADVPGVQRTGSFQIMRLSKYTYDWGQPNAAQQLLVSQAQIPEE